MGRRGSPRSGAAQPRTNSSRPRGQGSSTMRSGVSRRVAKRPRETSLNVRASRRLSRVLGPTRSSRWPFEERRGTPTPVDDVDARPDRRAAAIGQDQVVERARPAGDPEDRRLATRVGVAHPAEHDRLQALGFGDLHEAVVDQRADETRHADLQHRPPRLRAGGTSFAGRLRLERIRRRRLRATRLRDRRCHRDGREQRDRGVRLARSAPAHRRGPTARNAASRPIVGKAPPAHFTSPQAMRGPESPVASVIASGSGS